MRGSMEAAISPPMSAVEPVVRENPETQGNPVHHVPKDRDHLSLPEQEEVQCPGGSPPGTACCGTPALPATMPPSARFHFQQLPHPSRLFHRAQPVESLRTGHGCSASGQEAGPQRFPRDAS